MIVKKFICLVCAALLYSNAVFGHYNYSYIGTDFLYSYGTFENGYGRDVFNNADVKQYNVFVGHYFSRLFGFEVGYAKNINNNSMSTIAADSNEFGVPNFTAMSSNVYDTTQSVYAYNLNYVPQWQITQNISLIAVFGFSYMKSSNTLNLVLFDDAPATPAEQNDYNVNFSTKEFIPRLGLRLQYLVTNMLGIRASYIWENTDSLTLTTTRNINPNQTLQAKITNMSALGIGAFLKF